jgi:CheY-like chemotaxis protein
VQDLAPWVPREVAAIASGALQLNARKRYSSAEHMLSAIRQVVPDLDLHERALVTLPEEARRRVEPKALSLPPAPLPSTRGAAEPPRPSSAESARTISTNARILIVEDNEMNMDMLSRRLERKGYVVLRAETGESGIHMCRTEQPDLVLMDVSLPGMDGWEATRILRAGLDTRSIPIIALTARATPEDREKAKRVACDDYETKPVEFKRLLEKIAAILTRSLP